MEPTSSDHRGVFDKCTIYLTSILTLNFFFLGLRNSISGPYFKVIFTC